MSWSLVNTSAWLDVSVPGGTLASGAVTSTVVSLDPGAASLPIGDYSASVTFSNHNNGLVEIRTFTLHVTLVVNGGFETGDLTGWTLAGTTTISNLVYDGVISSNSATGDFTHSGVYGMAMGDTNIAYLYQSIPTVAGQDYLLSFWLENLVGGGSQRFLVNWNTNATTTNQIFNQSYFMAFGWTNHQFLVQASGSSVTLQFGAQNLPSYFGLDDISVVPINPPVFQTVSAAGRFTCN